MRNNNVKQDMANCISAPIVMSMACGSRRQAGQVEVKFMSNEDGLGSRVCEASLLVFLVCPCLQ